MHCYVVLKPHLATSALMALLCIANQSMKIYCVHEVKFSEVLHSFLTVILGACLENRFIRTPQIPLAYGPVYGSSLFTHGDVIEIQRLVSVGQAPLYSH